MDECAKITQEIINEVLKDVFPKTNTSDKSYSTNHYNKPVESKS